MEKAPKDDKTGEKCTESVYRMDAGSLRAAREARGLSQREMAEELQTPYRTYQDWERNGAPGVVAIATRLRALQHSYIMDRVFWDGITAPIPLEIREANTKALREMESFGIRR